MEGLKILELLESAQILERKLSMSLVDSGLRMPQYRVLGILKEVESTTVSELSKRLRITRAATSLLVNEMLKLEYIETRENYIDRRSFYITLSETGTEKLEVAEKNLFAAVTQLFRDMSEEIVMNVNRFSISVIDGESK